MGSKALARFGLTAVLVSLTSTALGAEPNAADRETARGLMARGRDQRDKRDFAAALESFRAADAIMHVPTTGYEVAETEAAMGKLVEARDAALAVARLPPRADEPAPFAAAREKARKLSDDLEGRIPTLVVRVSPANPAPEVTLDGAPFPAVALGVPYRLDPGHHHIEAKRDDLVSKKDVEVGEHDETTVALDLVALAERHDDGGHLLPHEHVRSPLPRILMYSGLGVGAAGLVVGTVTGLMALHQTSTLKDRCPNDACPPSVYDAQSFQDDKSRASTMGTISTVSFVVGGVGAGVGVVGLVLMMNDKDPPSGPATGSAPRVRPWVSPRLSPWFSGTGGGVSGSF